MTLAQGGSAPSYITHRMIVLTMILLAAPAIVAQQYSPSLYSGMQWRQIGPFRAGRVTGVTGVPGQPAVYYMGTAGGGAWKTTDGGMVWKPIFDKQNVASIGAIAVAPSNTNVVYIGTGDVSNVGASVNQGNGTFKEMNNQAFGHESKFSMGNDIADINHDGWLDVMTVDMLPADEKVLKSSLGDDPLTLYLYQRGYGYNYQYSRNCLQLNTGEGKKFSDIALYSGVAATDWSWSPLIADFNLDGRNDIFRPILVGISNLDFFRIFNRWGQLVYATTQNGQGWDGTLGGRPQETGTFVYMVQGKDYTGKIHFKKGTFILIR